MLSPYPQCKLVNLKGIDDVPEHWGIIRGRFVMEVNPPAPRLRSLKPNDEVSFVPMEAISEYGRLNLEQSRVISEVSSGYTEFQNDDIVVAKITPCFENGKASIAKGLLNGAAYGTTELHVLRTGNSLDYSYLFYLVLSEYFRKNGESEMYGAGGQKRVPPEFCKNVQLPIPSIPEQQKIVSFLNWKIGQIDALITKKQTLLEKLKEKRLAVITQAVTHGINPEAPLRDSGIPWLGKVPEHWEVKRLKFIGESIIGLIYDPEEIVDEQSGTLVLRANNIQNGQLVHNDPLYVSTAIPQKLRLRIGDILICSRNGSRNLIGKNGRVTKEFAGATFGTFNTVFRSVANQYLYWVMNSSFFEFQSGSYLTTTVNQLTIGNLNSMVVPLPPPDEQEYISQFLEANVGKMENLITTVVTAIERLTEYRSALITAATTGKIDVRNINIPYPEA